METNRAQEILNAPNRIEVLYKNNPVWIESVHKDIGTAHVTILGSTQTMEVPIKELVETGIVQ